ncbi:hypothetical protein OIU77_020394, partial [Salix suchowensis]
MEPGRPLFPSSRRLLTSPTSIWYLDPKSVDAWQIFLATSHPFKPIVGGGKYCKPGDTAKKDDANSNWKWRRTLIFGTILRAGRGLHLVRTGIPDDLYLRNSPWNAMVSSIITNNKLEYAGYLTRDGGVGLVDQIWMRMT